ncbi:MAG: hypothetical protein EB023_13165 [Flavobacteriia bacterium]|nr:hypothetical protein [Flavobacteriia bacterium]
MSLSDSGLNKVFKTGSQSALPYYYISASLDLAGAVEGGVYYFNYDNNFDYAAVREYNNYVVIDENAVISEVVVYANQDIVSVDSETYSAKIGGAAHPSVGGGVQVLWAAPAGNAPGLGSSFNESELNASSVHLFGHEGGHHPYDQPNANVYKFLAIELESSRNLADAAPKALSRAERRKIKAHGRSLPVGVEAIQEGKITVVLKIFPKFQ